jgi:hypothetical protein
MKFRLTKTFLMSRLGSSLGVAGGIITGSLALGVGPVHAAPGLFQFDTTISYPNTGAGGNINCFSTTQCDIALQSVKALDTGKTWSVDQLLKVTDVALLENSNDQTIGGVSADRGRLANGLAQESLKVETTAQKALFNTSADEKTIVAALGQAKPIFNLNNILDTEDNGKFKMDLLFDKGQSFDSLLLWGARSEQQATGASDYPGGRQSGDGLWRDGGCFDLA